MREKGVARDRWESEMKERGGDRDKWMGEWVEREEGQKLLNGGVG